MTIREKLDYKKLFLLIITKITDFSHPEKLPEMIASYSEQWSQVSVRLLIGCRIIPV